MRLVPFSCVDSQRNIMYKATPGPKERTIENQNAIFTTLKLQVRTNDGLKTKWKKAEKLNIKQYNVG